MFTCKACLKRAFDAVVGPTLPRSKPRTTLPHLTPTTRAPRSRTYATATAAAAPVDTAKSPASKKDDRPLLQRSSWAKGDDRPLEQRSSRAQEWVARKHLQYLKDPLHIATQVKRILDKDRFDEAALITKKASVNASVAVSWNHLIDYQLRHFRVHQAMKLYNEMKKRGQIPNAQTFTIIFRGCAKSPHPKLAVAEAVKLYQNMLSSSRIKPNTIHLNAVLQVCAKAGDLESMFSILQSTNDGIRAPNNLTYTTILNTLRATADKTPSDDLPEADIADNKAKAIQRAQIIWEEAISRWRSGSIIIDEEMVCAMGRVLLMGTTRDAASIEQLVEQTMTIPAEDRASLPENSKQAKDVAKSDAPTNMITRPNEKTTVKAPGAPSIRYALPGNNSLSMILSSLEKTGRTTKAIRYWGLFVKRHNVVPDADNWTRLLRVFLRGKNSGRTVGYLSQMPRELMTSRHIRLAMTTCIRDNLNLSSFHNATQVLELMLLNLRIPSVPCLRIYLRTAYANKRAIYENANKDADVAQATWCRQLAVALGNLWGPYLIAAKQFVFDRPEDPASDESQRRMDHKAEVVTLARKMLTAYDRLILGSVLPPEVLKDVETLKKRRNNINSFVVTHIEKMKKQDPTFSYKDQRLSEEEEAELRDDASPWDEKRNYSSAAGR
ncbi:Uu.00g081230.m01.CDS01 [Anthostomella pinea]|uniref:Uu.00g081230.m01.CDS01 n=1 Tax=Anthostomella pinea TaxID=933095 RepID=A0AAI8VLS5_9PEZI|nr:Uu.00g081230.m01.CDS01 [Anthostomella pinea]